MRATGRALALAAGLACLTAGCGSSHVTPGALQSSVQTAFGNLYVLHETVQGHPRPSVPALRPSATCQKGTQADTQRGPGNDWLCSVTYLADGPGTAVTALYTVDVKTDGCWAADGDGPASLNGMRTVADPTGATHPNPLALMQGCFDAG